MLVRRQQRRGRIPRGRRRRRVLLGRGGRRDGPQSADDGREAVTKSEVRIGGCGGRVDGAEEAHQPYRAVLECDIPARRGQISLKPGQDQNSRSARIRMMKKFHCFNYNGFRYVMIQMVSVRITKNALELVALASLL